MWPFDKKEQKVNEELRRTIGPESLDPDARGLKADLNYLRGWLKDLEDQVHLQNVRIHELEQDNSGVFAFFKVFLPKKKYEATQTSRPIPINRPNTTID